MTDTNLEALLDREHATELSLCPKGKKWGVGYDNLKNLYFVGNEVKDDYDPEKTRVVRPTYGYPDPHLDGHFTKSQNAEQEIAKYIKLAWDKNELVAKRAPAKKRAKAAKVED